MSALQTVIAIFSLPSSLVSLGAQRLLPSGLSLRETGQRTREWGVGEGGEREEQSTGERSAGGREMERGERGMEEGERTEREIERERPHPVCMHPEADY